MTAVIEKEKKEKDVCTVTEAAFPPPDTLVTSEAWKASCRPAEGPAVRANTLCASYALLTNF